VFALAFLSAPVDAFRKKPARKLPSAAVDPSTIQQAKLAADAPSGTHEAADSDVADVLAAASGDAAPLSLLGVHAEVSNKRDAVPPAHPEM